MVNYSVGDFLIRLKNAKMADRKEMVVATTKLIRAVADVLVEEGYLREVKEENGTLIVKLAFKQKNSVLMNIKLVSKLGLRVYKSVDQIKAHRGASIFILSTPKGVMSSRTALKENVGGEVIAEVW